MICNRCSFRYKSWSCLSVCMRGYCITILYNIVLYRMISYYTKSFFYIYSNTDCLRVCPGSPNAEQKNMWFCRENVSLHFSLTKIGSKMCSKLSHISNGKTSWQSERLRRREFYSMFTDSTSNATWVTERERERERTSNATKLTVREAEKYLQTSPIMLKCIDKRRTWEIQNSFSFSKL